MQLTLRDVARLFHVPEQTVYRWMDDRHLPAFQVQGQLRFNRAELVEWATLEGIPLSDVILRETPEAQVMSLALALERGVAVHDLPGENKATVMEAAVERLSLADPADREDLLRILLARESLISSGIGDGIAIPHVRNPIVLPVDEPVVHWFTLSRPVEFGATDRVPVRCLFLMISPTPRAHLQLLARLATALRHPDFRRLAESRAAHGELIEAARRLESGAAAP